MENKQTETERIDVSTRMKIHTGNSVKDVSAGAQQTEGSSRRAKKWEDFLDILLLHKKEEKAGGC